MSNKDLDELGALPRVLLIAFHFPPFHGSSGHQRALGFSRYLQDYDWQPIVLSAHPRVYNEVSDAQLGAIPESVIVKRAFALDARKHLSIRKAYPQLLAIPDRWVSWWLGAVPAGLALIRRYRPNLIWATYPLATSLLVAYTLSRLSGLPLVIDYRDPMNITDHGDSAMNRRAWNWLERAVVHHAARVVFTTPGAARMYAEKYPALPDEHWAVIANGYDENNFLEPEAEREAARLNARPLRLLHSGVLYKEGRNPRAFFSAISNLMRAGRIAEGELEIIFRGTGHDDYYRALVKSVGLERLVRIEPPVPYSEALAEMATADGLLIFQGSQYNRQIPAKVYEYMRVRRPILALADLHGDTAMLLKSVGIGTMAAMDSIAEISAELADFIRRIRVADAPIAVDEEIKRHSRRARAGELAELFDVVVASQRKANAQKIKE